MIDPSSASSIATCSSSIWPFESVSSKSSPPVRKVPLTRSLENELSSMCRTRRSPYCVTPTSRASSTDSSASNTSDPSSGGTMPSGWPQAQEASGTMTEPAEEAPPVLGVPPLAEPPTADTPPVLLGAPPVARDPPVPGPAIPPLPPLAEVPPLDTLPPDAGGPPAPPLPPAPPPGPGAFWPQLRGRHRSAAHTTTEPGDRDILRRNVGPHDHPRRGRFCPPSFADHQPED